jgi:hypothetical protein
VCAADNLSNCSGDTNFEYRSQCWEQLCALLLKWKIPLTKGDARIHPDSPAPPLLSLSHSLAMVVSSSLLSVLCAELKALTANDDDYDFSHSVQDFACAEIRQFGHAMAHAKQRVWGSGGVGQRRERE